MDQLEYLQLGRITPERVFYLMRTMRMPALGRLCLKYLSDTTVVPLLLYNLFPPLRGLTLVHLDCGTSTIRRLLEVSHTIGQLTLVYVDAILEFVIADDIGRAADDHLLPNLQTIGLFGYPAYILEMLVHGRRKLSNSLQHIENTIATFLGPEWAWYPRERLAVPTRRRACGSWWRSTRCPRRASLTLCS
ncbi:hypothetical protein CALCODRAFT_502652 [Calocera cornea HHB12733]|uniref:Uncharacterized protein n=1 Tax=Calocera cornea HHB12733 TaxID=1353952 RepID=A0A165D5Q4_9BASI|nr:hypothetical protein CALCODRAFT_502652 [Calocera cornea HHB12733]